MSRKEKGLRVDKKQPIYKENFEVVKKNQDLQQVIELEIEDTTCQKFDEYVKEKNVELIVDNDKNKEMVIIENILKNPIVVKYEDESTTHNPQILIDLLKMNTQACMHTHIEIDTSVYEVTSHVKSFKHILMEPKEAIKDISKAT